MNSFLKNTRLIRCVLLLALIGSGYACLAIASGESSKPRIDFDRDVRPILSENCFTCHGFDENKRQARLRLDIAEGAYQKLPTGNTAIVPENPDASMLFKRVVSHTMPPVSTGKKLTDAQIATLRQWIVEGGRYELHWSFVPPKRPQIPSVKNRWWTVNPIDFFILSRLEKEGLKPSRVADRRTLIRRVTLDLTGLPPTVDEVNAFLTDTKPGAYERVVNRLLDSPRYGERMALAWLDLARYADTHGYHIDSHRDMWIWRDWVINAFNRNLPFDRFTIEQLAGDLLPNATEEQKIATGFNRNHPINYEGGAIPEEYLAAYIFDRIDTTTTVWMGLTMRCAQCHDHKYDPLTQKDFYRFYAFFHNVPEQGLDGQKGNAAPYMKVTTSEQQRQLETFAQKIKELDLAAKARADESVAERREWESKLLASIDHTSAVTEGLTAHYRLDDAGGVQVNDSIGKNPAGQIIGNATWEDGKSGRALGFDGNTYIDIGTTIDFDRDSKFSYGAWVYPTSAEALTVISRMDDAASFRGWDLYIGGGKVYAHLINQWENNAIRVNTKDALKMNEWHHLFVTYDGSSKASGVRIYVDGKSATLDVTHDKLTDTIRTDKPAYIGRRNPGAPFRGRIDEVRIYERELTSDEVRQIAGFESIRPILAISSEKRTPAQSDELKQYYLENEDKPYISLKADLASWQKKKNDLEQSIPSTMVMQELEKPRETYMLVRGEYDRKGEKVTAGPPAVLPGLRKDAPLNRLGLAEWLADPNNPLTARVAVNRYWQLYFGTGLVKTSENLGTQGERPSHPELLDWLATEFVRTGWDIKEMQRLIVTSAAYRQSSTVTPSLMERDPENRLLARGPRFRLQAEFVRDMALATSGLLVDKIGGPSVKPYQPSGLWEEIAFGGEFTAQNYQQDHGDALYRRSMYTFWKRTCPPPSLQAFDAPEREFCMVRRSVTNTPLQALVMMNDPTYVEASRKMAERLLSRVPSLARDRIEQAFEITLSRSPNPNEMKVLLKMVSDQMAAFQKNPQAAEKLVSIGESKRDSRFDVVELATWTTVASVILNMDETITKG